MIYHYIIKAMHLYFIATLFFAIISPLHGASKKFDIKTPEFFIPSDETIGFLEATASIDLSRAWFFYALTNNDDDLMQALFKKDKIFGSKISFILFIFNAITSLSAENNKKYLDLVSRLLRNTHFLQYLKLCPYGNKNITKAFDNALSRALKYESTDTLEAFLQLPAEAFLSDEMRSKAKTTTSKNNIKLSH
jgi:hypothetical protein